MKIIADDNVDDDDDDDDDDDNYSSLSIYEGIHPSFPIFLAVSSKVVAEIVEGNIKSQIVKFMSTKVCMQYIHRP
jgi:hypothetical protein